MFIYLYTVFSLQNFNEREVRESVVCVREKKKKNLGTEKTKTTYKQKKKKRKPVLLTKKLTNAR